MCTYILLALLSIASFLGASGDGAGCALSLLQGKDGHLVMITGEKHASSGLLPFHSEYKSAVISHISQMVSSTKAVILYEESKPRVSGTHAFFYKKLGNKTLEEVIPDTLLFSLLTLCIPGENNPLHNEIVKLCNFPEAIHEHLYPCDVRFGACEVIIDVIYYLIEQYACSFQDMILELVKDNDQLYSLVSKLDPIECTEEVLYGKLRTRLSRHGIDCEELTQVWKLYLKKHEYDFLGEQVTFAALYEHFEWLKALALENSADPLISKSQDEADYWRRFYDYLDLLFREICSLFEVAGDEDLYGSWLEVFERYCQRYKSIGAELEQARIFHDFSIRVADFGVLHRIFTARKDNQPVFVIIGDEHRKTLVESLKKLGYTHVHTEYAPRYRQDYTSRDCYLYQEQYDALFNRFYGAYFNVPGSQQYVQPQICVVQQPILVQDAVERLLNF